MSSGSCCFYNSAIIRADLLLLTPETHQRGNLPSSVSDKYLCFYLHALQYGSTFLLEESAWVLNGQSCSSPDVAHSDGHPGYSRLAHLIMLLELHRKRRRRMWTEQKAFVFIMHPYLGPHQLQTARLTFYRFEP